MNDLMRQRIEQAISQARNPELADAMRDIVTRALSAEDRRAALPCQDKAPQDCAEFGRCEFAHCANVCPIRALEERVGRATVRLRTAEVPERERRIILAHTRGATKLKTTAAAMTVTRWLKAERPATLLVLSGPPGVGKTLASAYALSRKSGRYVPAYAFARPGLDMVGLKLAPLVVVDQLDFDGHGVPPYAVQQLCELIEARYAECRSLILCTNMLRPDFERVFGATMADRLAGDGQWVALTGASQRTPEAA